MYLDKASDRHVLLAGMKLARVCRLVGITSTSNVAGADRYGLDASGTMAHSYVMSFDSEEEAVTAANATVQLSSAPVMPACASSA